MKIEREIATKPDTSPSTMGIVVALLLLDFLGCELGLGKARFPLLSTLKISIPFKIASEYLVLHSGVGWSAIERFASFHLLFPLLFFSKIHQEGGG